MSKATEQETTGAWVIHHGKKVVLEVNGPAQFPAIDIGAKAASLLTKLSQTNQSNLRIEEVRAIAVASGLNPNSELPALLDILQRRRLVDRSSGELAVLGVTTRASLAHAEQIYKEHNPTAFERASISLAEIVSQSPSRRSDLVERIGDEYKLTNAETNDFFDTVERFYFVDKEGEGDDRLLFNGNLFRRDCAGKTKRVLQSLTSAESEAVREIDAELREKGCLVAQELEDKLSSPLFEKLIAAGIYDLNYVTNDRGNHVFVTAPAAFHKFVDPMIDDCFDMAKQLVAALTYGMKLRSSNTGRINNLPALLGKLLRGNEVGPATGIGQDYRTLEIDRVVQLRRDPSNANRFYMRLLKNEVGQLALEVLSRGDANEQSLTSLMSAPMAGYVGPEANRVGLRRRQSALSKKATRDVLEALRGGRDLP